MKIFSRKIELRAKRRPIFTSIIIENKKKICFEIKSCVSSHEAIKSELLLKINTFDVDHEQVEEIFIIIL